MINSFNPENAEARGGFGSKQVKLCSSTREPIGRTVAAITLELRNCFLALRFLSLLVLLSTVFENNIVLCVTNFESTTYAAYTESHGLRFSISDKDADTNSYARIADATIGCSPKASYTGPNDVPAGTLSKILNFDRWNYRKSESIGWNVQFDEPMKFTNLKASNKVFAMCYLCFSSDGAKTWNALYDKYLLSRHFYIFDIAPLFRLQYPFTIFNNYDHLPEVPFMPTKFFKSHTLSNIRLHFVSKYDGCGETVTKRVDRCQSVVATRLNDDNVTFSCSLYSKTVTYFCITFANEQYGQLLPMDYEGVLIEPETLSLTGNIFPYDSKSYVTPWDLLSVESLVWFDWGDIKTVKWAPGDYPAEAGFYAIVIVWILNFNQQTRKLTDPKTQVDIKSLKDGDNVEICSLPDRSAYITYDVDQAHDKKPSVSRYMGAAIIVTFRKAGLGNIRWNFEKNDIVFYSAVTNPKYNYGFFFLVRQGVFTFTTDDEKAVLEKLYKDMGPGTLDWKSGDPCNDHWRGVYCEYGRVVELNLDGRGLSGAMTNLENLNWLKRLYIRGNKLSGIFDPGRSKEIIEIDASDNQIKWFERTGYNTWVFFYENTCQEILTLKGNNLLHTPQIGWYGPLKLKVIDFQFNSIESGSWLNLQKQKLLEVLNFATNDYRGTSPLISSFSLRVYDISYTKYTTISDTWTNFQNLIHLDLTASPFTGDIPVYTFARCRTATQLTFRANNCLFTGIVPYHGFMHEGFIGNKFSCPTPENSEPHITSLYYDTPMECGFV